jgi:hypothetical protein
MLTEVPKKDFTCPHCEFEQTRCWPQASGNLCNRCHRPMDEPSSLIYQKVTLEPGMRLADVICPQCKRLFRLTWNDYSDTPETLHMRSCPSGGIYNVTIACPHCDYEEEL